MNLFQKALRVYKEKGWRGVLKGVKNRLFHFWQETFHFILTPFAKRKIRLIQYNGNMQELIDFSQRGCFGIISSAQYTREIAGLLGTFEQLKPRIILEIGTLLGGTLFLFSKLAPRDALVVSVDLPKPHWRESIVRSFVRGDQKIHTLGADSHKQETLERVGKILDGRKIDFLFIDGDHSYEGVKRDFEMYGPLVREGGVIAFHDIVPGLEEVAGKVSVFWKELKSKYRNEEFVRDWNQGAAGIGVIFK